MYIVLLIVVLFNTGLLYLMKRQIARLLKDIEKQEMKTEKFERLYQLMCEWVSDLQNESVIESYFQRNNFHTIAIYGMGDVGVYLSNSLKNIEVKYAIDQSVNGKKNGIIIKKISDELEPVDAIIVTPITSFDDIERQLTTKVKCPIISIEDVIFTV